MTITRVGLREAEKSQGNDPTGKKQFLVASDTQIDDDIDTILDASGLSGQEVPAYNDLWSLDTTVNLRVTTKRAIPFDSDDGVQEGYYWLVDVNYAVPDISDGQSAEDPTQRDWLWSKSSEKEERALVNSLFDTSDYVYPEAGVDTMVNLGTADAITNTAFEPPENGVSASQSNRVITLSKYINAVTDLGVASWPELDAYIDTINDGTMTILDVPYEKWQARIDDIDYEPVSENGYDVIRVVFRIVTDTLKTHVFSFPSSGYNEIVSGKVQKIRNKKTGEDIASPRLLDADGAQIDPPGAAPFISTPYIVSAGRNSLADFSTLNLPVSIP